MSEQIILPYPKKLKLHTESLSCGPVQLVCDDFFNNHRETVLGLLAQTSLRSTTGGSGHSVPVYVRQDASCGGPESYRLAVHPAEIVIEAFGAAGAFYAFETLRQLTMLQEKTIPCMEIEDAPAMMWRGFLLDTCRTFFPVSFIKKMIDAAALHKMNRFHWHLTDDQGWRLPVPGYPLLTETGAWRTDLHIYGTPARVCGGESETGFYSEDEIRDVVKYAADRFVTVVPEVEIPGHASAMLAAYPELGCTGGPYHVEDRWGIFPDIACAGNDDVFALYGAVFDQLKRLFPAEWVHIGGDECMYDRWKSCPKCQARMKKEGLSDEPALQAWVTSRVSAMLAERGKITIGWDEVLDGAETCGLSPSFIVQSWRGAEGGEKGARMKHQVIMSPQHDGCYFDHKNFDSPLEPGRLGVNTVKAAYTCALVPRDAPSDMASYVIGGECTLWTEAVTSAKFAEYMMFPRLCAFSEALWDEDDKKDFARFSRAAEVQKRRLAAIDILCYQGVLE